MTSQEKTQRACRYAEIQAALAEIQERVREETDRIRDDMDFDALRDELVEIETEFRDGLGTSESAMRDFAVPFVLDSEQYILKAAPAPASLSIRLLRSVFETNQNVIYAAAEQCQNKEFVECILEHIEAERKRDAPPKFSVTKFRKDKTEKVSRKK